MIRSLNTAATGMVAQQFNLDVIANNLANVNTTGFKQQRAEFQDLLYQTYRSSGSTTIGESRTPEAQQLGLGVKFAGNATNFSFGAPQQTGDPYNMAIIGNGFFQVQKNGETFYTRDGTFKVDASGKIVNSDGYSLVPEITVPAGTSNISISNGGVVSATLPGQNDPQTLGEIQLAVFANPAGLTRIGQNLFQAGGASGEVSTVTPGTAGAGEISQGFIEGSNVQIVEEMVRMILAQRAYETNSKAIQTADDMLAVTNNLKR